MQSEKIFTSLLTKLSPNLSNKIGNFFTKNVSIERWDKNFVGLQKLPIKTVIDIGANEGQSSRKLNSVFPDAIIYAFEPSTLAYAKLLKVSEKNPKIKPFNLAIGDKNTEISFFEHSYFTQSSSVLKTTEKCEEAHPILTKQKPTKIKQTTLNDFFQTINLESEILIKIDVQGYEDRVIKGGEAILGQASACIIEVSNDLVYEDQASFEQIFDQLRQLNYQFLGTIDQVRSKTGAIQYFDAVFVKKSLLSSYQ